MMAAAAGPAGAPRRMRTHSHDLAEWRHDHVFDAGNRAGERGTRLVLWITAATMVLEIAAGWTTNSMALLADGWHMSSHVLAIGLSAFAYALARRHAQDPRYAFGTWKIEVLAGFSSALLLLAVAALMVVGSVERLLAPTPIHYPQALLVALIGLGVNLLSARILGAAHHHAHGHDHGHDQGHDHGHDHGHDQGHDHRHHQGHDHGHDHGDDPGHDQGHHHGQGQQGGPAHGTDRGRSGGAAPHDLNLRSAYLHVLADAATSLAAIFALAGGWWFGWVWLDPAIGIAGAVLVAIWARGLLRDTGKVLLDREMDHPVVGEIQQVVAERGAASDTLITDLHVWRVGKGSYACALSLLTHDHALMPDQVREWLAVHTEIVHSTIEIRHCPLG
jgi:cation diffusion facilitator family transporter